MLSTCCEINNLSTQSGDGHQVAEEESRARWVGGLELKLALKRCCTYGLQLVRVCTVLMRDCIVAMTGSVEGLRKELDVAVLYLELLFLRPRVQD